MAAGRTGDDAAIDTRFARTTGAPDNRGIGFRITAGIRPNGEGLFMRQFVIHSLAAAAIGALLAFPSAPAFAKTAAECNADYAANKAAIKASGQTRGF